MQDTELIYLETEKIKLTIKGQPYHPDLKKLYPAQKNNTQAELSLEPLQSEIIEFLHYSPKEEGLVAYREDKVFPCFYEWQSYEMIIHSKTESEVEFYHQNKNLRQAVTPLSSDRKILTGKLQFRNNIGYSKLELRQAGQPLLALTLEVFPSRINYKQDYQQLLAEVNQEVYNLAYDFLRRTFQQMELAEADNISYSEFFAILNSIFADFKKAFQRIKEKPHRNLSKNPEVKPAARVKRASKQGIKWLQKNPAAYDKQSGLPKRMLSIKKEVNFNTFENKFVKWMIKEIIKQLNGFKERYKKVHQKRQDKQLLRRVKKMKQELKLLINHSFLKEVGELYKLDNLSLVLQMAPGYREVYKYYLMLKKGLSVNGELFNLSLKETWELYEYWCFLKLNQILRQKYKLVKNNLIAFDHSGLYVTLSKARSASVEYENPKTGEKFSLAYNTRVGETITTGQQPDNILTLQKEDSSTNYKFIFDAKYRINPGHPGSSYYNKYGTPGPKEDTINAMHRYRDAIVSQDELAFKRSMVGAYVLFPYHNGAEFQEHHFYKSIEKVNVGAFPFLPGNIELVADFLAKLVEETALSNYERNLLPEGKQEYHEQLDFKRNVLVGSLSQPQQLEQALSKNLYHIPCEELKLPNHQIKYVAIYQSRRKFPEQYGIRYYATVDEIKVKVRKEIPIPLSSSSKSEKLYYLFRLKQWTELNRVILPEGYGVRSHIFTNDMLLKKATTLPELSIKTLAEWRLWLELKRVKAELKVLANTKKLANNSQLKEFRLDKYRLLVEGEKVIIKKGDKKLLKTEIKNVIQQPRNILNMLK